MRVRQSYIDQRAREGPFPALADSPGTIRATTFEARSTQAQQPASKRVR